VPDYLPAAPTDPYDNQPIRFRVSTGELIRGPWRGGKQISWGQSVLWCVGEDHQDNGGRLGDINLVDGNGDVIYLVPLPPGPEAAPEESEAT
jgi:hypothetical protein